MESSEKYAASYKQKVDTATVKEKRLRFMELMDESRKNVVQSQKKYKEVEAMKYADIKKAALEKLGGQLERRKGDSRSSFW